MRNSHLLLMETNAYIYETQPVLSNLGRTIGQSNTSTTRTLDNNNKFIKAEV